MTDTAEQQPTRDWKQQIIADYPAAIVRLATLRAEKRQHLIFGWVELYPVDMSAPDSWRPPLACSNDGQLDLLILCDRDDDITSVGMVRGIVARLARLGCRQAGFDGGEGWASRT